MLDKLTEIVPNAKRIGHIIYLSPRMSYRKRLELVAKLDEELNYRFEVRFETPPDESSVAGGFEDSF